MNTILNNYDMSSTGTDIELSVFYDTDLAMIDFEDSFTVFQYKGYRTTSCLGYDTGEISVEDIFQASLNSWKAFREFCLSRFDSKRDCIEEKILYFGHGRNAWPDMAYEILNQDGIPDVMKGWNGYNLASNYDVTNVSGFSQSDYALVIWDGSKMNFNGNEHEFFRNLLFAAPIYARLTVNNKEHYLEEAFSDRYRYDKDELVSYVNKLEIPDTAKAWIAENAPEHPDYI